MFLRRLLDTIGFSYAEDENFFLDSIQLNTICFKGSYFLNLAFL